MRRLLLLIISIILVAGISAQDINIYPLQDNKTSFSVTNQSEGIHVVLSLGSFSEKQAIQNGIFYSRIMLEDGISIIERGLPDIQYLNLSVAIPLTGRTSVLINNSIYEEYTGFNIAPTSGDPGIYTDKSESFTFNEDIYNHNAFYPAEIVKENDPYIFGTTRGQSFHFFPVQFNPVTGVLRVYTHIDLTIAVSDEPGKNELTTFSPVTTNMFNQLTAYHYANEPVNQSSRYSAPAEEGNMLVISHPDFMETMIPFIEWKNQKGIHCEMVDVTKLGSSEQIKKYVSDYYYEKGLTFLLLVGDNKYIPTNQAEKGPSDNMYGYISGDDHYPEILVGRFSCETTDQCITMVERTINYEKNPELSNAYSNFLGIASDEGPGDDNELDFEHIRNIIKGIKGSPYRNTFEMYDGSQGGNDKNGNPSASMVSEAINNGQGAVMYIGHGSLNSWITSEFHSSDIKALTNSIHPFVWAAGCDNGNFTDITCFAEQLLRVKNNNKPAGAVAALMSSANQTWFPPMEAQDEIGMILAGQSENNALTFGGISLSGCMKMNDKYGFGAYKVTDTWILFGDPSVEIRTAAPTKIQPKHPHIVGYDVTSITVSDLYPGMMVAISSNGTLISSAIAENNVAEVSLPSLVDYEKLMITVTGKNIYPYISEIEITANPSIAIEPTPGNHFNKVLTTIDFNWLLSQGVTPSSYTFCIRKEGTTDWISYNTISSDELSVPELEYLTTYEWKVISKTNDATAESALFTFTTIEKPDEDFEQTGFPRSNWLNSHEWFVDTLAYEGNYSLHSGSTESREFSSLIYECETLTCDFISFQVKVNRLEEGSGLTFYMDGFPVAIWNYTMGWTHFTYEVEPGEHIFEWRFIAGEQDSESAAWLDNIYFPTNEGVIVEKLSQQSCPQGSIQLEAIVQNHASIQWKTNGTGYFDDPSKVNAVYYPSQEDLQFANIPLELEVNSNNICDTEVYSYNIDLLPVPEVIGFSDTTLYLNESYTFSTSGSNDHILLYTENNSEGNESEISSTNLVPGENRITVLASNAAGCSTTKEFIINVIAASRPQSASLTIYPNPALEQISIYNPEATGTTLLSIYSAEGMLIQQHTGNSNLTSQIQVNQLNPGLYIVRSENNGKIATGKFLKL